MPSLTSLPHRAAPTSSAPSIAFGAKLGSALLALMAACLTFHASSATTAPAAEPASTAWDGATFEPPFLAGCTPNLTQAAAGYVEAHSALWPDQSDQLLYHDFVREWGFTPAATSTVTCGAVSTDSEPALAAPGSIPPINEPRWAPTIRYELLNSKTMTAKQGLRLLRAQHLDAGASEADLQVFIDRLANKAAPLEPSNLATPPAPKPPARGDKRGRVPDNVIGVTYPSQLEWANATRANQSWYFLQPLDTF